MCQRVLTRKQTLGPTAHLSEVTALPFSPSQNAVMPSTVNLLYSSKQSLVLSKLQRRGGARVARE